MRDNANQDLTITASGHRARIMKNTIQTREYVRKLSFAAIVKVTWPDGTWKEFECGEVINRGSH